MPGTAPIAAFTLSPDSTCFGSGCSNASGHPIEADTITFNLTGLNFGGGVTAPDIHEQGTFTAKYSGAILGCAAGDGVSPSSGETDCMIWSGASNTYNGSTMISELMSNGETLDITFFNATDWNITPRVSFDVVGAPEPSTWAMMLIGFAGLGFAAHRSRRRPAISIVSA